MKLRERDEPLDPRAERELEAVDRALAGLPVDPDLAEWGELATLVAGERPDPTPEWSAELDELAAARFRDPGSTRRSLPGLGRFRPMQILAPAGALATVAVITVVGVSTLSGGGTDDSATSQSIESVEGVSAEPSSGGATPDSADSVAPAFDGRSSTQIAPGTLKRREERDVSLSLSTRPENVREVSDEAISITRSFGGIVNSSQVSEAGRQSSATLQLTIPTRNLDAALDGLTGLANVKSLDESTLDITKPFVSAQDRLRDAEAERRSLLKALANASTEAEADALQQRIDDVRREISQAEAAFDQIGRRARLSDVALTVVGDPSVDEDRSIGDWFDDALSVLRDVAGVLLIAAAIVVPLGVLMAIGWLALSRLRHRRREQALD